jgi:hypothetical protein
MVAEPMPPPPPAEEAGEPDAELERMPQPRRRGLTLLHRGVNPQSAGPSPEEDVRQEPAEGLLVTEATRPRP